MSFRAERGIWHPAQDKLREESWVGRHLPAKPEGSPRPRFLRGTRWFPARAWSALRMTECGAPCTLSHVGEGRDEGEPVLSHHRCFTSIATLESRVCLAFSRFAGCSCHSERSPCHSERSEESWVGRQLPAKPEGSPRPRFLRGRRWFPVRAWSPLRMTEGGAPCTLSHVGEGRDEGEPVLSHHVRVTSVAFPTAFQSGVCLAFSRFAGCFCHSERSEESWVGRQPPAEPDVLPRPRFLRGRRWFPVRAWSPLRMTVWRIMVVSPRWTYVPLVARVLSIPCLDGLRGRTRRPTEGLLEFVVRGQMLTSKQSPHESQLPLPFKRPQLAASLSECILPFEQLITQRFGVLATLLLKDLDDLLLMPSQADISPEPAQLHFCEKRCKRQPLVAPRLVAQTTPFFPGKSHLNHASVVHELHANKPACCNAIEHPTPELEHCS